MTGIVKDQIQASESMTLPAVKITEADQGWNPRSNLTRRQNTIRHRRRRLKNPAGLRHRPEQPNNCRFGFGLQITPLSLPLTLNPGSGRFAGRNGNRSLVFYLTRDWKTNAGGGVSLSACQGGYQ
jgi:hypothetical protein